MNDQPSFFERLLPTLRDGTVTAVQVGLHWNAVVVDLGGETRCGLSSSVSRMDHYHNTEPDVGEAGRLADRPVAELARLVYSQSPAEVSIGLATINAALPPCDENSLDLNAEEVIARCGAGKNVALIGHFPFVPRLRQRLGRLWVLEQQPRDTDLPAEAAEEIVPQADVLAITAMTLINKTFDDLMRLHRPGATILLLGPSTPLTPLLYDYGVQIISGSIVEDIPAVLRGVTQGGSFRQVHRLGVRLVSMTRDLQLIQEP